MPKYSLDNVTIDGFRGLRNLHLENLGLINVLVGENNSGKTSVLEALSILCNPLEPLEWLSLVRRRDFGGLDETRIQSLRWCFFQSGQLADPEAMFESECRMTSLGGFPLRSLTVTHEDIVGEPTPKKLKEGFSLPRSQQDDPDNSQPQRGAEITHRVEWDSSSPRSPDRERESIVMQVWEHQMVSFTRKRSRRGLIPTETLTPYSYQINRLQVSKLSQRLFDRRRDMILELIRDFDPDVLGIEIASTRGERPALYLNHRRLGPAPLSIFGDALRRALLLASTLSSLEKGGLLLIDEIETGIHVSVLQRVFDWLERTAVALKVQIVATTHSLEAVDSIALAASNAPGVLVTYHVDQTEQETRVKRIDGELLLRLRRERGLDVR